MDEAYKESLLEMFNETLDDPTFCLWSPSSFGGGFAYLPLNKKRTKWVAHDGSVINANLEQILEGWIIGTSKWATLEDEHYPWDVLPQYTIEVAYIPRWAPPYFEDQAYAEEVLP